MTETPDESVPVGGRVTNRILDVLVVFFLLLALARAVDLAVGRQPIGDWLTWELFAPVVVLVVRRRVSLPWRRRAAALLAGVLCAEFVLEFLGWLVCIPGINTAEHMPYARVIWTQEGASSGMMNRHGWYSRSFRGETEQRLVLIGDSFVEALQVDVDEHMGALLEAHLNRNAPPARQTEVLELGLDRKSVV
mgnify:CR=1 FL=1